MKATFAALLTLVLGMGCGGDPNEKANKLFVEAVKLIVAAETKNGVDAIKDYDQAISNLQAIINDYSESDLAVELISGKTIINNQSFEQVGKRYRQLKADAANPTEAKSEAEVTVPVTEAAIQGIPEDTDSLNLDGNKITDLAALRKFSNVRHLSLSNNRITDLTPLAGLTELGTLELSGNLITDLSPLAGLTKLETLELSNNQITDLSPLAGLTKLETLWVEGNQLSLNQVHKLE